MKTGARIFNLVLAGVLGCVHVPLHAAEPWSAGTIGPMQAVSLDQDDKHIVGYFSTEDGLCRLTLMIEDLSEGSNDVPLTKPSRVIVGLSSGRSARIDTEARTLSFTCEDDARSMSVMESGRTTLESRS